MNDVIEFWKSIFEQMSHWPASMLLFACLIALGWVLKSIPWFPNRAIPAVVLVAGAVAFYFVGDVGKVDPHQRYPSAILCMYGMLIGAFSWAGHALVLKRLERFIPGLKDDDEAPAVPPKP